MKWWTGPKEAIDTAQELAADEVVGQPEYLNGVEVPKGDRVTKLWDIPRRTAAPDVWAIAAYEKIEPEGVELVDRVDWPEIEDEA